MVASSGAGDCHRLLKTTPAAMTAAPAERRGHPERVQPGVRTQHEQGDPGHPRHGGHQGAPREPLTEQPGRQQGDQQRLDGADGRRHPAGQPVRPHEQQREEHADVQRAQHQRPPPPDPARQAPGDGDEQQTGGQGPEHRGQERPTGRKELGGDEVRGAPDGGGQRGHEDESRSIS
ncbi:hypothetical protein GCM10020220_005810 [Nonomuraea rubra]